MKAATPAYLTCIHPVQSKDRHASLSPVSKTISDDCFDLVNNDPFSANKRTNTVLCKLQLRVHMITLLALVKFHAVLVMGWDCFYSPITSSNMGKVKLQLVNETST